MTPDRFDEITRRYAALRVVLIGDFCLDRYLEIDPALAETSIETGRPVRNVVRVRSQPGGAGTILNNLVALGVGQVVPIGFCGEDGEGYELRRALAALPAVGAAGGFLATPDRRTFTYCKPLVMHLGRAPEELDRLDSKNWTPTPEHISRQLADSVLAYAATADAVIVLDQVDREGTGVVTADVLAALGQLSQRFPAKPILADSRRGLASWPPLSFKMNAAELSVLQGGLPVDTVDEARAAAAVLARLNQRPAFITLSERGIVAAAPDGSSAHAPSLPTRGPIDIVGAGDSVTANLAAALAAGASLAESLILAMAAASTVVHQLGTTGTATVADLAKMVVA